MLRWGACFAAARSVACACHKNKDRDQFFGDWPAFSQEKPRLVPLCSAKKNHLIWKMFIFLLNCPAPNGKAHGIFREGTQDNGSRHATTYPPGRPAATRAGGSTGRRRGAGRVAGCGSHAPTPDAVAGRFVLRSEAEYPGGVRLAAGQRDRRGHARLASSRRLRECRPGRSPGCAPSA